MSRCCNPTRRVWLIADALGVDHQTINNDTRGENLLSSQRDTEENEEEAGEKSPPEPPDVEGFAPDELTVHVGEAAENARTCCAPSKARREAGQGEGWRNPEDAA